MGFKNLLKDGLVALMNDLALHNTEGFPNNKEYCTKLKTAILIYSNGMSTIPDTPLLKKSLIELAQNFYKTYVQWNDVKLGDLNECKRVNYLFEMQKLCIKLAKRRRKVGRVLEKDLDLKVVEDFYKALGDLIKAFPDAFKAIIKAVHRFNKRKRDDG